MAAAARDCYLRGRVTRVACAVLLCAVAQSVRAQDPRADLSLLGPTAGAEWDAHRQLDLRWSLAGAYDDDLAADAQQLFDPQIKMNGAFATESVSLLFKAHGKHASFSATAASGGRYYPDLQSLSAVDGSGNVTFAADMGAKTKIHAAQGITFQPYYELNVLNGLMPDDAHPIRTDPAALTALASHGYAGSAGVTEQFSSRSQLSLDYEYRYTQFSASAQPFVWQLARTRFTHHLTKDAALRVGYAYGAGQFGDRAGATPFVSHDLDLGIDYSRALAFSRRTTVSFGSGSTLVPSAVGLGYFVNADASLNREVGRTWKASLGYHRGIQLNEGFVQPLYVDTALLRLGGLVTRRVSLLVSASYSAGQIGLAAGNQRYGTYNAESDLRIGINRTLAAYAHYMNYRYTFNSAAGTPFGLPPMLNRQGLRVGISGWLPLLRSGR